MEGGQLPYQDWARELRDERVANDMKDNPDARIMLDTDLIEFVCNENEQSSQHFDP